MTFRRSPTSQFLGWRLLGWATVVVATFAALLVSSSQSAAPDATKRSAARNFPGGPYFTVVCGFSHRNNDDPILFPGQPGRSHNHTFIGNRSVDASTTPASLRGGPTTCDLEHDASTYWVPTVYLGQEPITPLAAVVYYTKHTSGPVATPPLGLKMLAGNPNAHHRQAKGVASWSCGGVGGTPRFSVIPVCAPDDALELNVRFPNCWNGKSTDSPDHRRHMAYSSAAGQCPESHPVRMPTITLVLLYPPQPRGAQPASGKFAAHGDFINGWDQDELQRLVAGLNFGR